jgi:hypothetical protein
MASDYVDIYRRLMDKTDETAPCEPEPEEIELSAVA